MVVLAFLVLCIPILSISGYCEVLEVKVPTLPVFSSPDVKHRAESAVVKRFLELNPNINLIPGTPLKLGEHTMDTIPLMQIAGDISPDILYVNFRMSDGYVQRGFLMPLDSFMENMSQEEIDRRVPPSLRDVCYRKGPDGKKYWYMLPTEKVVRCLIYRKDLFERAGLDPDRPPRTWSELEEYCRKLSDPSKDRYGIGFKKGEASSHDFANLVWSAGGDIIIKDDNGNWQPNFDSAEAVEALYYYARLNNEHWTDLNGKKHKGVAYRDVQIGVLDPTGKYAMAFGYLSERLNIYQPEMVGYAPVPRQEDSGKSASEINARMYGVFAKTSPSKAQAAFDYISFLDSDEANKIRVHIYIQSGYGRFLNPDLLKRFGYTRYLEQVDKGWLRVYEDVMLNGKPEPYGKNCAKIYTELSRPVEQTLYDSEVQKALDRHDESATKKRITAILKRAQAETAKRMYGTVPKNVAKLRHRLTYVFLVFAFIGFASALMLLIRTFRREAPLQVPGQKRRYLAYLLLLPAAASIFLWQYVPLIRGTIIAFQDYSIVGISRFVGIENFSTVLFDANFWHSMKVTFIYTLMYMVFGFLSPIFLALILHEIPRGKMFFRTMFYLPAVLSGLVVIFLWKSFYTPSGLLNTVLSYVGIHFDVSWLDVPHLAMAAVLLPVVWAGMGPGCLIYLAALKTIPEEYYEAAEIDGAGITKKVTSITLPGLKMLILINAVGSFIGAFMTSESILAMTGGGPYTPYGATEVVGLQLFYTAFAYLQFGVANAMAWVLGFMLIGFTLIQLRQLSRVEFKGGR